MSLFPQVQLSGGREPKTLADPLGTGFLPDTAGAPPTLPSQSMGNISDMGAVSVMVNQACTITIWYYNKVTRTWRPGGIAATDYALAFAHPLGGIGYFNLPAGARFYLTSDTASTICYHDGEPITLT